MRQLAERAEPAGCLPVPQLIDRCADPADLATTEIAWAELVRRYDGTVAGAVRRTLARVGDEDVGAEVEDLVQDVYCRLLDDGCRRLVGFRGGADRELRAWLRRVATRVTYDHLRACRRRHRSLMRHRSVESAAPVVAPRAGDPDRRLAAREERHRYLRRVRAACGSSRDARILALVVFAGWKSREVASSSLGGLSASGVDSIVYRVRRRLAAAGVPLPER